MTDMLRGALSENQIRLLQVIYEPFQGSGAWPYWQYVDVTMLNRFGTDAAEVLVAQWIPVGIKRGEGVLASRAPPR